MQHFDSQLAVARKILPARISAYEAILKRPVRTILEIGCGSGAYARAFDEMGLEYCAIEIDRDMASFALERSGSNIIAGDFVEIEIANEYDIVFFSQVLEHVKNPCRFLQKAKSIAHNGLIHFDVPNQNGLAASLRKMNSKTCYGSIEFPFHMIGYNDHALKAMLEALGI